jgi:hypothetical protein
MMLLKYWFFGGAGWWLIQLVQSSAFVKQKIEQENRGKGRAVADPAF